MELSSRVLLRISLQVVGVITLIDGICHAIGVGGIVPFSRDMMPLAAMITSILIPLVSVAAGIFLLVGTRKLIANLYPDEEEKPDSARAIFNLAMKVLGMVLIVKALPDAVQLLSNIIYIKSINPVFNTDSQQQFIYTRLLSTLLYFIFGWYLVRGGKFLERLAFPPEQTVKNKDE